MRKRKQKQTTERAKPKVTRLGLVHIVTYETFAGLEKKLKEPVRTAANARSASLSSIRIANKVFQWRRDGYDLVSSQDHVFGLAKALENSGKPLEPILVLPVGEHFYVIDGHHRIEAYHSVKWSKPVPIELFRGSLKAARIEAFRRNSKDKLPMSKQDKMEGTWALVKEGELTAKKISDITGSSERQIYYMRSTWKEIRALPEEQSLDRQELTWAQARAALDGEDLKPDDDWKEKETQKLVDALLKAKIGQGLMKHPDITAEALARINGKLPETLVWEWFNSDDLQTMVDEMGEEQEL
jgi:hypothetical protein